LLKVGRLVSTATAYGCDAATTAYCAVMIS
jgi:hypothetical protein